MCNKGGSRRIEITTNVGSEREKERKAKWKETFLEDSRFGNESLVKRFSENGLNKYVYYIQVRKGESQLRKRDIQLNHIIVLTCLRLCTYVFER